MANTFDRITQNPNVLAGRATIRGLRISVSHVVNLVANGMTPVQIVADLHDLEEEDVRQALAYAAALAQDELHTLARTWTGQGLYPPQMGFDVLAISLQDEVVGTIRRAIWLLFGAVGLAPAGPVARLAASAEVAIIGVPNGIGGPATDGAGAPGAFGGPLSCSRKFCSCC